MMLWPTDDDLVARRRDIAGSPHLHTMEEYLLEHLKRLRHADLYLPPLKAALTPSGGTCPADGARLTFDPYSPHRHRCPVCGIEAIDDVHDRTWVWRYHLWLSERAIHAALLGLLRDDQELRELARRILAGYVGVYPQVPNRDNVLGPTRLFFSTYLESIWLLQLTIAAGLLGNDTVDGLRSVVRESASLIRSFDEGWSNRQVWHNAAMIAAARWLGDDELMAWSLDGPHGLRAQLARAVTKEGFWFEGENYHFFALRGFVLAAEVLRGLGVDLYANRAYGETLAAMYRAPLATLLPDLTIPARGDAPFGVSVRQARFAELWELGRARTGQDRLAGVLAVLYAADLTDAPDDGERAVAEQEHNRAAGRLHRDRLGWKALAWMLPEPPVSGGEWMERSRLLTDAGVAVLRGPERAVSLECGGEHGGHGHPDLLHLSVYDRGFRLTDFGTGSYVRPSLHWYRSTLAHNAPGVAGIGQLSRVGWCEAIDQRDAWAWCMAVGVELLGPGTAVRRTVIMGPDFLLDGVEVEGPEEIEVDLPLHPMAGIQLEVTERDLPRGEASTIQTGYASIAWAGVLPADTRQVGSTTLLPRDGETLLVGEAPGPPTLDLADGPPLRFLVRRARGPGGWWQVHAYEPGVVPESWVQGSELVVRLGDSETRFRLSRNSVRIRKPCGNTVRLGGARSAPEIRPRVDRWTPKVRIPCRRIADVPDAASWRSAVPATCVRRLGAREYRRSEIPYDDAGGPAADVATFVSGARLGVAVEVSTDHVCLWTAEGRESPDNEPPEILVDGVQWYVDDRGRGWRGVVAVPVFDGSVRTREVGTRVLDPPGVDATWCRTPGGYSIVVTICLNTTPPEGSLIPVNLAVNLTGPERTRRMGQLCLSGGGGWVYLRGDREPREHAATVELQ